MNKTILVISAILTALILIILGGVVYGVQGRMARTAFGEIDKGTPMVTPSEPSNQPASGSGALSPQEIGARAANAINRTDIYSIESVFQNGEMEFLVTFSSGDVVRLDGSGQVIGIESPQATAAPYRERDDDHRDDHDYHDDHDYRDDDDCDDD